MPFPHRANFTLDIEILGLVHSRFNVDWDLTSLALVPVLCHSHGSIFFRVLLELPLLQHITVASYPFIVHLWALLSTPALYPVTEQNHHHRRRMQSNDSSEPVWVQDQRAITTRGNSCSSTDWEQLQIQPRASLNSSYCISGLWHTCNCLMSPHNPASTTLLSLCFREGLKARTGITGKSEEGEEQVYSFKFTKHLSYKTLLPFMSTRESHTVYHRIKRKSQKLPMWLKSDPSALVHWAHYEDQQLNDFPFQSVMKCP